MSNPCEINLDSRQTKNRHLHLLLIATNIHIPHRAPRTVRTERRQDPLRPRTGGTPAAAGAFRAAAPGSWMRKRRLGRYKNEGIAMVFPQLIQ